MEIEKVEELYRKNGANEVDQDYRDLVSTFRRLRLKVPIPNTDYLHGLYLIDLVFQNTNRNIRMLNGIGESSWLDVLKDSLVKTLGRIKERGGCLKAIFIGEGQPPDIFFQLRERFGKDVVKYIVARANRSPRHFIACDGRMLRLEEFHELITQKTPSDKIIADVYLNNPNRTKLKEKEFDEMWDYLKEQA